MYTTDGVIGFPSTPVSTNVGIYSGIRPSLGPEGPWYAHLNYMTFTAASTTITNSGSSIDVFQLAG
jgi:hypothetical protein